MEIMHLITAGILGAIAIIAIFFTINNHNNETGEKIVSVIIIILLVLSLIEEIFSSKERNEYLSKQDIAIVNNCEVKIKKIKEKKGRYIITTDEGTIYSVAKDNCTLVDNN